ncbi:Protein kinase superfamily protein [Striga hermonthica]|uniref:Receptor-like serine/threonine-protein kinase n=1 Tax=Striga hermonthica TaxID=68872 RepID=A0A9N7MSA1_STRHE|nr:Protein kinase superfamily protein [Striga hermonthica]
MDPFFGLSLIWVSGIILLGSVVSDQIVPGSRLYAGEDRAWVSDNGSFAFGFAPVSSKEDRFQLGVWYAQIPGDRTLVWSADINSPVPRGATVELQTDGDLVLRHPSTTTTAWSSNTSLLGIQSASMSENGNFILFGPGLQPAWQTFSHTSDTLLPGQPLTVSLELKSSSYTLKMLQQPNSLSLALAFNTPEPGSNLTYWSGPDISNVTGDEVVAVLDSAGNFGILYGPSGEGAVYVYKNDNESRSALNRTGPGPVPRRLTLETNGNLRLYKWAHRWVSEWAAVSNPCDIAGTCGNGICRLDRSQTNPSCTGLPGHPVGKCSPNSEISVVQQTGYYYSESSVIANYSDLETVSKCGDMCLSDCECVGSVYGLDEENAYCWVLRELEFGGYENPGSTLFVKVEPGSGGGSSGGLSARQGKVLVLPIVLSMTVLVGLLFCLLYINVHRKRKLKRALESSLIVSGVPVRFSYRDLQLKTSSFSQLLGTGGFGSVYKGCLSDGTLIAVKKLDRVLPHGEKEFVTEVNTISSMHHMNLVRLCGYCSEGSQRLLVYEFMKNGSLDKWIFPPYTYQGSLDNRVLDWSTRFRIAIGTAQGIAYFHEQCRDRIIHCDIKPENILLDENFCPKVSDFGLAKLMGREASQVVTMVRGTRGYLAPEWVSNRPITVKADVYSYGMLLLEIIGGRRNLDMSYDAEDFFYPGWAFKEMTNGTPTKAVDRRLEGTVEEEELVRALKVAFWCIQDEIVMRPTMGEVVKMLEGSVEGINVPPIPQTVLELVEEGLDHVYKAMKREFNFNHFSSFTTSTHHPSSRATCSYSTMSPR